MEARGNSENKAHPNWRAPQQGLPMTIRGGGNPKLHMVLRTDDVEWARRPGASPPMRMLHNGSDPRESTAYKSAARPFAPGSANSPRNLSSTFWLPASQGSPDQSAC